MNPILRLTFLLLLIPYPKLINPYEINHGGGNHIPRWKIALDRSYLSDLGAEGLAGDTF
jgi:hypothetical protein